jgi:hypothetical protein
MLGFCGVGFAASVGSGAGVVLSTGSMQLFVGHPDSDVAALI